MASSHRATHRAVSVQPDGALPPLESGDHLDQKTFHARYERMTADIRAELIGGVVYLPSPLKPPHARMHVRVAHWLTEYEGATPGTEVLDNATAILGPDSEPQPDACLLVLPDYGGQTFENTDGYLEGAPELIVEVASTSDSYDLHSKKRDYERAGVREYVVVALRQDRVFWFVSRKGRFKELTSESDGIFRSTVFPGLWLDPVSLLQRDRRRVLEVLRQGLSSAEHAVFLKKLAGK